MLNGQASCDACTCFSVTRPEGVWAFHSVARSGQESIAQGLPWVIAPARQLALKGSPGTARFRSFAPNRRAQLLAPFGAGLSGRMTGAKHIRTLCLQGFRIENRIVRIARERFTLEPRRPT